MWAAANGHVAVVKALLAEGADPSAADKDGNTALMAAAREGHLEVFALIQQHLLHLSGESLDDAEASSPVSSPRP